MVKNLLAMWETWVQSLGWEDPLEEGMASHSSILPWRIPRDRGNWLHPLPLSHPSRSSQSAMLGSQFHSDFSPAIYFTHGSVNKSVLLSLFTWLSPSSTMCTSVLYILHSFPAYRFINTIFQQNFSNLNCTYVLERSMHHGQLLGEEKLNWEAEKGTGVKTGFRGVQIISPLWTTS